jgi:hypothetical protein
MPAADRPRVVTPVCREVTPAVVTGLPAVLSRGFSTAGVLVSPGDRPPLSEVAALAELVQGGWRLTRVGTRKQVGDQCLPQ